MYSKIITRIKKILAQWRHPSKASQGFFSNPGTPGERMAFYSQFIKPEGLCFDIGANIGDRTDIFLELGARVVCVEPQPNCLAMLRRKYNDNHQVSIIEKGVDTQSGIRQLSICGVANTISTFSEKWKIGRFHDQKWETEIDVTMTTLDRLIQEFGVPNFVKIDVEGFEYQVLQGLSSPVPMLSFEFTKEFIDDVKLCMNHLKNLGMVRFNYTLGESPNFALPQWSDADLVFDKLSRIKHNLLWGDIYSSLKI